MSEKDNPTGGELKFIASTHPLNPERLKQIIDDHTKEKKGVTSFERRGGWSKREISKQEQLEVQSVINAAEEKLTEIGIPNTQSLVPTVEHMSFLEAEGERPIAAQTGQYNNYIKFYLPSGYPLTDSEYQATLLHEISHFVTPVVLKTTTTTSSSQDVVLETVAKGFDREPAVYTDERGIFEEGLADLFALFVLNKEDLTIPLAPESIDRTIFTMALLKEFAKRSGISPVEVFIKIFKGKVLRDYSAQKELVDIFGTNVIRGINNIDTFYGEFDDKDKTEEIAKQGGFLDEYKNLRNDLAAGRIISFPGIQGHFKGNPPHIMEELIALNLHK